MDIRILVASHKQCNMPSDAVYLPVHVGHALHPELDLGFQPDDRGENISRKNPYYSELTAIYWAWRNLKADYIGLAHYRRHFRLKRKGSDWASILTDGEALGLCRKHDIILPRLRRLYIETVYSHYDHTFDGGQLDNVRLVMAELCPDYLPAFDMAMRRRHVHLFNMFIMKHELFDDYCSWLFPLLEKLEAFYDLEHMDPFQARLVGRVSERLLDVWIMKNGLHYHEIDYIYFGKSNYRKKVIGFLMAKFFGKRYKQSF